MRAAWRARFPQIVIGLLLGSVIVWLWNGRQIGVTALLCVAVLAIVAAPRRERGEQVRVVDETYDVHPDAPFERSERRAARVAHLHRGKGDKD